MSPAHPTRPLSDIRVVHLASWGPAPYACMLLADLGCDVTIVDRTSPMIVTVPPDLDPRRRSQKSIALNLKHEADRETFYALIEQADIFIEGMRPGAAEKLNIGPDQLQALNKRLIYARMTGWGQTGPLANTAGHDINYLALSGALDAMGTADEPAIPLNLLGDYAGGGMFMLTGILAALIERQRSGLGQVIDGAIVDGVASLSAATLGMLGSGSWGQRGTNTFDGSTPWYALYATADNKFVAVGAIEEAFYQTLMSRLGLNAADWPRKSDDDKARLRRQLTDTFKSRSRDHWAQLFEATDACVTPVLSFEEAMQHPHHKARQTYIQLKHIPQPAPGPRFSRTELATPSPAPTPGEHEQIIQAAIANLEASNDDQG